MSADGKFVKVGKKPEDAKQDAAQERPRHAEAEIAENAKSPAVPLDDHAGYRTGQDADNDPNDDMRQANFHGVSSLLKPKTIEFEQPS